MPCQDDRPIQTFCVRQAIPDDRGDPGDIGLAEPELEEGHAGRSMPAPLEDLMKAYGLAD